MRRYVLPLAAALAVAGAVPAYAGAGLPKLATLQAGPYRAALHNDSPRLLTGRNTLTVEIGGLPDRHVVSLALVAPDGRHLDVPLRPVLVLDRPTGGHGGADDHGTSGGEPGDGTTEVHGVQVRGPFADTPPRAPDPHGRQSAAPASAQANDQSHGVASVEAHHGGALPAGDHRDAATIEQHHADSIVLEEHHGEAADSHTAAADQGHASPGAQAHVGEAADAHASDAASAATADHGQSESGVHEEVRDYLARGVVSLPSAGAWTAQLVIHQKDGGRYVAEAPLEAAEGGPNGLYLAGTGALMGGYLLYGAVQRRRQPPTLRKAR